MSKVKVKLELEHPTIIIHLTPEGLKIHLEGWQHNAPVRLLAGLDIRVQQAIHQWRARFLAQEREFNTPSIRETEAQTETRRMT